MFTIASDEHCLALKIISINVYLISAICTKKWTMAVLQRVPHCTGSTPRFLDISSCIFKQDNWERRRHITRGSKLTFTQGAESSK